MYEIAVASFWDIGKFKLERHLLKVKYSPPILYLQKARNQIVCYASPCIVLFPRVKLLYRSKSLHRWPSTKSKEKVTALHKKTKQIRTTIYWVRLIAGVAVSWSASCPDWPATDLRAAPASGRPSDWLSAGTRPARRPMSDRPLWRACRRCRARSICPSGQSCCTTLNFCPWKKYYGI